jgi:hypothetical protein
MTEANLSPKSNKAILLGGGAVVLAAVAVLFVLPAEFGIDPTGLGEKMGLTKIADPGMSAEQQRGALREGVLTLSDSEPEPPAGAVTDHWERSLAPFESIEFKYTLSEGEPMVFAWSATGEVGYDMHAHPFDGGEELTESYGVDDASSMQGTYVPAFTGIHGWYWQNKSSDNVTLTLDAAGTLTESTIFEGGGSYTREIALEDTNSAASE